jgi:hypothetical protein
MYGSIEYSGESIPPFRCKRGQHFKVKTSSQSSIITKQCDLQ